MSGTSIDYSDTISCTSTNQCTVKYGSNGNWVCDDNNQKCVKKCSNDSDCGSTNKKFCMYDSEAGYNKCNDKDYQSLSVGCLSESDLESIKSSANVTSIESNTSSIDKCVDWARNQTCDGSGKCEYMIYKEAIDTPIDWDNFSANVTCGSNTYSISSKLKQGCLNNGTYSSCVYDESNSVLTSALQDAVNELGYDGSCTDYKLNYSYKCQNEPDGQTSTNSVNFTSGEIDKVSVNMSCPVGDSSAVQPVCISTNLSNTHSNNTNPNTCSYPIYNVPNYYSESQLASMAETQYASQVNQISEEIAQSTQNQEYLRAKQIMLQQRMSGQTNFTITDAYNLIQEEEQQNTTNQQTYNASLQNTFNKRMMNNLQLQRNDSINISKLENEKLLKNKKNLNGLDKRINTITNNIYKSQKTEQLNVKITYFLSIFLLIIFLLAILIFIFIIVKKNKVNINMNQYMGNE